MHQEHQELSIPNSRNSNISIKYKVLGKIEFKKNKIIQTHRKLTTIENGLLNRNTKDM